MRERKHPSELQSSPPTRSVGARCSLCSSPWTSRTPPQSLQHDGKHTWMENTTFGPNFQNKTLSRWGLFSPWDEEAVTLILVENSSCFRRYSVRLYAAASKEKKEKRKKDQLVNQCVTTSLQLTAGSIHLTWQLKPTGLFLLSAMSPGPLNCPTHMHLLLLLTIIQNI